jgi:hypothetical protein
VLLLLGGVAWAQEAGSLETRIRQLAAVSPKAVAVVFDVSGSMEKHDMLSQGREAVIRLVRGGLKPGDRWVVFTFDTATRKAVERVVAEGGIEAAVETVPGELSAKPGTNIRWAHHEALRWVEKQRPRKTFLILVSDSYNDPPAADDPARGKYAAYYRPNSLTSYPDSVENRAYERLLRQRDALGITTWGIGVRIDPQTGRPIERYLAPPPVESAPAPAPTVPAETGPEPDRGGSGWIWIVGVVAAGIVAALLWSRGARPVGVSLSEGSRSFRNYQLRPGAAISLGGAGAAEYDLGYPIAGTPHPVALLRRSGKSFRLEPAEGAANLTLMVNGAHLKTSAAIAPGDEIKIRLPAGDPAAPPREVRLEFGRTREEV